jgi:sugar phosphate isomerase/epimerase
MTRRYSLAYLTVPGLAPPEMIDVAARTGYAYVGLRLNRITPEESHYPLIEDVALRSATRRRLDATGVGVWDVEVVRLGPDTEPEDYRAFLETGAELGARHVIAQLPDPDLERATERFGRLCLLAAELGMAVDLEFIASSNVPDLRTAAQVLRSVDQPNAGILVDALHFHVAGSTLAELRSLPRQWFRYVHLCDAPAVSASESDELLSDELLHVMRHERLFPGDGLIDPGAILDCLDPDVVCVLEIPGDTLASRVGLEEYARLARATTEEYLAARKTSATGQEEKTG